MRVLIVQSEPEIGALWGAHLERGGVEVFQAGSAETACALLRDRVIDVILLDLEVSGAFSIADFAHYRQPGAAVISVTRRGFFSDGSIFRLMPNARAFLPAGVPPADLAAVVDHCAAS
jgi:DNA-binding response OmpR family regulator